MARGKTQILFFYFPLQISISKREALLVSNSLGIWHLLKSLRMRPSNLQYFPRVEKETYGKLQNSWDYTWKGTEYIYIS
jgi:hypothetical protein